MLRLRQIAVITADLDKTRAEFFAVLGITEAYEDPAVGEFGLRNFVVTLGNTYLEVLTPVKSETAASRFLQKAGGDGGYMLIVQTNDLAAMSKRIESLGIRKTWEYHLPNAHVFHMHPKDTGGSAILSFDEMVPADSWAWAGPGWERRAALHVGAVTAVDVLSPSPVQLAERWGQLFERRASRIDDVWHIPLDQGTIRIRESPAPEGKRIHAIEVEARDRKAALAAAQRHNVSTAGNTVTLCGVQFRFVGE